MAHANDVLMNQLLANANDPSWHIPFQQSVEHLTEDEAFWTPANDSHSIVEIIQHLLYWNETWQTRYRESRVDAVPSIGDNHKSFIIPDNATFAELRDRLLMVLCVGRSCCRGQAGAGSEWIPGTGQVVEIVSNALRTMLIISVR